VIRLARVLVVSILASLALCGPAAAIDRYVPMKVGPAPGPAPARNRFLKTVVPFLRRIAR
jgi:hypothetical protein